MASSEAESANEKKLDTSQSGTGRWWDQYYVRYFVGTLVGAAIIFTLRDHAYLACDFSKIVPDFNSVSAGQLTAVATAGLAYCYIASAPILALHAVRGDWFNGATPTEATSQPQTLPPANASQPGTMGAAVTGTAPSTAELARSQLMENSTLLWFGAAFVAASIFCCAIAFGWQWPRLNGDRAGAWILGLATLTQGYLIGRAFINRLSRVGVFYSGLVTQRKRDRDLKRDYIESYRHLREHGNAFAIVICEILLGVVLAKVQTETQFIASLVLWMLPASSSWIIGTWLEARLAFRNLS
jgi:hypothetical protein